jgi:homoserine kinase type II
MSVFTPVSVEEARAFVARYHVGDIIDFQNIAAGVENSNFFVTTTRGRFVLTIFEKIPRADLDYYLGLMLHLRQAGIACASPILAGDKSMLGALHGKPAALVERLNGNDLAHPKPDDCRAVGEALARMHLAAQSFGGRMQNWRGPAWWREYAGALAVHLSERENRRIADELLFQRDFDSLVLPRGHIHGDLFRDNILWDDHGPHHTPQMIDFYFACEEKWLFDLAVTVNDWCLDFAFYPQARLNNANAAALLQGYASVRAFGKSEVDAWPAMLRAAALRTWLGRLGYHHFPRSSELTHPKDHMFSEKLLCLHVADMSANRALIEAVS